MTSSRKLIVLALALLLLGGPLSHNHILPTGAQDSVSHSSEQGATPGLCPVCALGTNVAVFAPAPPLTVPTSVYRPAEALVVSLLDPARITGSSRAPPLV